MSSTSPRNDHHLPAALIGGFSVRSTQRGRTGRRYAEVAVRDRSSDTAELRTAEDIAATIGAYRLTSPPSGVSQDAVDELWVYESSLPGAVEAFEAGSWSANDWETVLAHITATWVRHPDFQAQIIRFRSECGDPISHRDEVQYERVGALREMPAFLAAARFLLARAPEEGPRFIINDKGITTVEDAREGRSGVFFPLSGRVGILMAVGVGLDPLRPRAWLAKEATFTGATVEILNRACWRQPEIGCVISHPHDLEILNALDERGDLTLPGAGPYRSVGGGMYRWAFET